MADFTQLLNKDGDGVRTSARYDTGASTWLTDTALYAKNGSGIWTPVSATDPMPIAVKGSTLPYAQRLPAYLVSSGGIEPVIAANDGDSMGAATNGMVTKGAIYGFNGTNWDRLRVDANKNLLVTVAKRGSITTQTHNAVSVAASGYSVLPSSWQNCSGYVTLQFLFKADTSHNNAAAVQWSVDGSTAVMQESVLTNGTRPDGVGSVAVRAPYYKIIIYNNDAGAAHTDSAWVTLQP